MGLMRAFITFAASLGLALLTAAAQAQEGNMPTCSSVLAAPDYVARFGPIADDIQPDCVINWVQHDQLQRVIWRDSGDPDVVTLDQMPHGTAVLIADRPPHLIDIDQDGWLDVAVFTLLGLVNGDYDIFRFDPTAQRFVSFGTMWGSSFWRHEDGYLVAAGRSSAAASGVEAFRVTGDGLTPQFGLYVDAGLPTGPDGAAECRVSAGGQIYVNPDPSRMAQIYPASPGLIAEYCDYYGPTARSGISLMDVKSNAVIVPDGTVFHCQLEGTGTSVTVTRDDTGYSYVYGPANGAPELEMRRTFEQITVLPDNGAGHSRFGEISFTNGAYDYTVYYAYQLLGDGDVILDIEDSFIRGLIVTKDQRDPVFDKPCSRVGAYDSIVFLDRL